MNTVVFKGGKRGMIKQVLTSSTGYVLIEWENGTQTKEMSFNLINAEGNTLKKRKKSETEGMSRGEKKRYNDKKELEAYNNLSRMERHKQDILHVNSMTQGNRTSLSFKMWEEKMSAIWIKARDLGDKYIVGIHDSVFNYMRATERQAYALAKFADENNIEFINN
ncbi:hypothetical protein EZS27_004703 [termite gut metagenome]|uniref:Uncharacterized protein n=1 Tax=termite gut metagenome TaxID=433724 RepID=A0A5J4SPF5_9ZZZZ